MSEVLTSLHVNRFKNPGYEDILDFCKHEASKHDMAAIKVMAKEIRASRRFKNYQEHIAALAAAKESQNV